MENGTMVRVDGGYVEDGYMADICQIIDELSKPLKPEQIKVKKIKTKQGEFSARYIDARDVYERFNAVCPGQWSFRVIAMYPPTEQTGYWTCHGRMTVCGVEHDDVGMNDNEGGFDPPKAAASDCIKRCAVHFGFGAELYEKETAKAEQKPANGAKLPTRPWNATILKSQLNVKIAKDKSTDAISAAQIDDLNSLLVGVFKSEQNPAEWVDGWLFWFGEFGDIAELTSAQANVLTTWLKSAAPDVIKVEAYGAFAKDTTKPTPVAVPGYEET